MGRNPVQNHTNAFIVHIVHKIPKIIRRSIPCRRCIVPCHLIAPGGVKGMLHNRHQLYMRVAHFLHVGRQLFCNLTVIIEFLTGLRIRLLPGTQMQFINQHGRFLIIGLPPLLHPFGILPMVVC